MVFIDELKIGNWILDGEVPVQVTEILKGRINHSQANGAPYDELNPIPLSPEVLERCGFETGGKFGIYKAPNGSLWELYGDVLYFFHRGTRISTDIRSLHQLQNLFWCLSGTELEYNP